MVTTLSTITTKPTMIATTTTPTPLSRHHCPRPSIAPLQPPVPPPPTQTALPRLEGNQKARKTTWNKRKRIRLKRKGLEKVKQRRVKEEGSPLMVSL